MVEKLKYRVHPKEKIYYLISLGVSLLIYLALFGSGLACFTLSRLLHAVLGLDSFVVTLLNLLASLKVIFMGLLLIILTTKIVFIGYLRGSAISINRHQFPEIYRIVEQHAQRLQLSKIPRTYLLHDENLFNAFVTKFWFKNYMVLYNSVLEAAYGQSIGAVEFIIGHELGHIKRGHLNFFKTLFLLPASMIPFLKKAYSRACEYTCDSIGHALSPTGASAGILILATGRSLYKQVDVEQLFAQFKQQKGFCTWMAELLSTYPLTIKRLQAIHTLLTPGNHS